MKYPSLEPLSLLEMPANKAEVLLNQLPLEEQAALVLGTPWERRQDILLMSNNIQHLVRGMPAEELFWTIKAVGPQDALQILGMATPEQLQFIFDLDWWRKDNLVPEKIIAWLILLFEAGDDRVGTWIGWISRQDETLLPLILRLFVRVQKRPDDLDLQEARDTLPPFTLDDVYFIAFKKDKLAPLVSRILAEIMAASDGLYRDVMETILWETGAEGLEAAFRLKNARLSDFGISDYYDSLDIYAPIAPNQVRKVQNTHYNLRSAGEELMPAFIPTLYMGEYPALRDAIKGVAGSMDMERVIFEWTGVANKVLMADAVDLDDPEAQKKTLISVAAALNLAIELLMADEKGALPADILRESVLEDLVRLAYTKIKALRSKVRHMMANGVISTEFSHLPDHWEYLLEGLIMTPRPRLWNPASEDYEDFDSLAQINQTEGWLKEIETWGLLMARIEPHWSVWRDALSFKHTNLKQFRELSWRQALLTALAQKALSGELAIKPVREKDLMCLRNIWFKGYREGITHLDAMAVEQAVSTINPLAVKSGIEPETVYGIIAGALNDLYDEISGLTPDTEIDGRFITALWIELGQNAEDQ